MKIVQLANFYSPTSGGLRTVVDTLVSDRTTLLAVGDWAREKGVRTVLLSHERLDRWIEARVPRLWGPARAPAGC